MRFPDFLIIGAAKAGTTSLFFDLRANPGIFMPRDKEAGGLLTDAVFDEPGRSDYARLFAPARPDQRCGEAPTAYSKLPEFPGVPGRALRLLGPDARVVYAVREPIARMISHHHQKSADGIMPLDIDRAVREFPELMDWGRYATQIRPWIETFGADHVRIIVFEEYTRDRAATVADVTRFLGVDPRPDLVREDTVYNRSEGRPAAKGPIAGISRVGLYRRLVRPLLPLSVREALRRALLAKSPPRPDPPSAATVGRVLGELAGEADELRRIMGRERPIWDLDAVRRRYDASVPEAEVAPR